MLLTYTYNYYISGSSQLHLALLHSCELVVYLLSTEQNDEGLSYMLNLVYKHSLPRTACNMTWGPFGATNGMLTIIESPPSLSQQEISCAECFVVLP